MINALQELLHNPDVIVLMGASYTIGVVIGILARSIWK